MRPLYKRSVAMINFGNGPAGSLLAFIEEMLDMAHAMESVARVQNLRNLVIGVIIGVYALRKITKQQYEAFQAYTLKEFDQIIKGGHYE